jgi:hypothetical protein
MPLPLADAEIVATVQRDVLTPARIERAITRALDRYAAETATTESAETRLTAQVEWLERECARLAGLLAGGEALPSLLEGSGPGNANGRSSRPSWRASGGSSGRPPDSTRGRSGP